MARSSSSAAATSPAAIPSSPTFAPPAVTAAFVAADLGAGNGGIRAVAEAATEAAGGHLDILVNNAATLLMPTPTADISEQELRDAFAVNVFAPFLLTGVIAPQMAAQRQGAIVNIGSITGLRGSSGSAIYSANKAAIHSFTKSWAARLVVALGPTPAARDMMAG